MVAGTRIGSLRPRTGVKLVHMFDFVRFTATWPKDADQPTVLSIGTREGMYSPLWRHATCDRRESAALRWGAPAFELPGYSAGSGGVISGRASPRSVGPAFW